jgi:flagellar biosynthesis chaperone FliJ
MDAEEYETRFTALESTLKHLDEYESNEGIVTEMEKEIRDAISSGETVPDDDAENFLDVLENAYVQAKYSKKAERKMGEKDTEQYIKANQESKGTNKYRRQDRIEGGEVEKKAADAVREIGEHYVKEDEYQRDINAILNVVDLISDVSPASRRDFLQRVGERQEDEKNGYDAKAAGD